MSTKLQRDLAELTDANIITPEVSQNISSYYASKATQAPNRLFAIFGVLGSLLIGLGIILILAHNWDDFSRGTKTMWAFVPLVMGQLFVAYTLWKKRGSAWKETAATFLFFAIGSSISLVSQIYNIPGSMSSFLFTWILLATPLVYLLKSHAATLLFLIFSTTYACNVGYFNNDSPWEYLGMILWVLPFYWKQIKTAPTDNLTGIYHWLVPISVLISLGAFVSGNDTIGFLLYVMLFGLFYTIGKLPYFDKKRLRVNGYALLGSLGTITVLLFTTFSWYWKEVDTSFTNVQDGIITLVLGLVTLGVLVYSFRSNKLRPFNLFQYAFLLFGFIYISQFANPTVSTVLSNLLVFALGIFAIRMGARKGMFSILNYGLLIITVLITCRFFDTEISFVIRGLLFLLIGVGFFATNYYMFRKQKKQQNTLHHE